MNDVKDEKKVESRCEETFVQFLLKQSEARFSRLAWGYHTARIARALQAASDNLLAGKNTYLLVNVPPRHGKSELCSRRFPVWHLLRQPDHEIILATYGETLSHDLSRHARRCFSEAGAPYGLSLAKDRKQLGCWNIEAHHGGLVATGLGGSLTGRGADVLIVDDYVKNRADAESKLRRDRTWDGFRSDLMSRLAPAHAVVILATRWHRDDLTFRILNETEDGFPRFEHIQLPALFNYPPPGIYAPRGEKNEIDFEFIDSLPRSERWLFPERFKDAWYEGQRAVQGTYNWSALFMGNPIPPEGCQLRADRIKTVTTLPKLAQYARGWDLASTQKQRQKDDPDYTAGVKIGWFEGDIYIADVRRGQWSAGERDETIVDCAKADGDDVALWIEAVGGYKDAQHYIRERLYSQQRVNVYTPRECKEARANFIERKIELGQVFMLNAPWNRAFIDELREFPNGRHDDQVDAFVLAANGVRDRTWKFEK